METCPSRKELMGAVIVEKVMYQDVVERRQEEYRLPTI